MTRATAQFVAQAASNGSKRVTCSEGDYRVWRSYAGAEVWFHYPAAARRAAAGVVRPFDPIVDLMGLSVCHRGLSAVRMRIISSVAVSASNPLDGICVASLPARAGKGRPMAFTFEHVGFALDRLSEPLDARVQVIGIAHKVWSYASEHELLATLPHRRLVGRGALLAVDPSEIKDVDLVYRTKPGALWVATGMVKRSMRLVNPETREPYVWLLVETDRGDIDILANPAAIVGDVSTGHTLQAVVSMAGRLIERLS